MKEVFLNPVGWAFVNAAIRAAGLYAFPAQNAGGAPSLKGKRVAILATDGFEQAELMERTSPPLIAKCLPYFHGMASER